MIGVGLDVVDIERFREVLARRPAMHQRLFTDGERALAAGRTDPVPALAVRFAAKEAVMKALGVGLGAFCVPGGRGACGRRRARRSCGSPARPRRWPREQGVTGWQVSLSHSEATAAAVVNAL